MSKNFGVNIAASTIRGFLRRELKWKVVCTRLGPMIRDMDKAKRVEFAQHCIECGDNFDDVIWTDESCAQLQRHVQFSFPVKIS